MYINITRFLRQLSSGFDDSFITKGLLKGRSQLIPLLLDPVFRMYRWELLKLTRKCTLIEVLYAYYFIFETLIIEA